MQCTHKIVAQHRAHHRGGILDCPACDEVLDDRHDRIIGRDVRRCLCPEGARDNAEGKEEERSEASRHGVGR
jgi:hypothetical protein